MIKRSNNLKNYFKKNNIKNKSVKVDIAYFKISKIFESMTNKNIVETIDSLLKEFKSLIVLWKFYDKKEFDRRTGRETYGYKNIETDLKYISDRFSCQFRIRWLIDLLSTDYEGRILKQRQGLIYQE
jgi:hypothetical protein